MIRFRKNKGGVESMNRQNRILVLIGFGMLLLITIVVFPLQDTTAAPATEAVGERFSDAGAGAFLLLSAALIASLTFLLAFGIYFHRKVSVPLSELLKGAEELSRGNLDHRIHARGTRDITALGERFNEMAAKLRQSHAELERAGGQGRLGSAIRHEINNPLSTVIGNVELLMERYEDRDKELAMRLVTVLNSALRIAEIVKQTQGSKQNTDSNKRHDDRSGGGKANQ
jgi:signal transduction histidine kinase